MLGGFGEPAGRVALVAPDSLLLVSVGVEQAESVFGGWVAAASEFAKLREVGGIGRQSCACGIRGVRRRLGGSEDGMFVISAAGLELFVNPRLGEDPEREKNCGSGGE